jgi:two-component system KDP operon response regulator KdpE
MNEEHEVRCLCDAGPTAAVATRHGGHRQIPRRASPDTPVATLPAILVADDDPAIAALVREVLEGAGYRVVVAPTHAAALAALAAGRHALVLCDTEGPVVGGDDPARWDSVQAVRAAAGDTPVAIFSAHPPRTFAGWRARGFAGLVSKPFDLDDLVATVRALVGPA